MVNQNEKKYPVDACSCAECIHLNELNTCIIYGFKNLIPTIKGCDKGD